MSRPDDPATLATLRTDDFDFELPRAAIADRPAVPRDAARMLVVEGGLRDMSVCDLPSLLASGDVLVVNDTRVIPARLVGRRGKARIEVTLHRPAGPHTWRAFARPARRLKPGDVIVFAAEFAAEVVDKFDGGEVALAFAEDCELMAMLARHGRAPLPPYIARAEGSDARDAADYQTVYAAHDGAVAAPTAGLHFTEGLLDTLRDRGVRLVTVTLHVGAGTFLPVKAELVRDHRMQPEWGRIDASAAEAVNAARAAGGRIVAAGSTSLRLLETAADEAGHVAPFEGETVLFITPGYRFRAVDVMLTNFHLPRSTLFMLVSAFAGRARMRAAYDHAKEAGYRFYSYGDACLLFRENAP